MEDSITESSLVHDEEIMSSTEHHHLESHDSLQEFNDTIHALNANLGYGVMVPHNRHLTKLKNKSSLSSSLSGYKVKSKSKKESTNVFPLKSYNNKSALGVIA